MPRDKITVRIITNIALSFHNNVSHGGNMVTTVIILPIVLYCNEDKAIVLAAFSRFFNLFKNHPVQAQEYTNKSMNRVAVHQ